MISLRLVLGVFCLCLLITARADAGDIKRDFINPANGYTQVVAVTQEGPAKTLHISGQIGEGENLESQLRSAWTELGKQLQAGGAEFKDLVKITTYIVNYRPADLAVFRSVRDEFLAEENRPASTLIGVDSLALRKWLVEIEAVAVISP